MNELTDLGRAPAMPAPNWCPPDTQPRFEGLSVQCGGGVVCDWNRRISDDVWIQAENRIINGRVMRSPPAVAPTVSRARQRRS